MAKSLRNSHTKDYTNFQNSKTDLYNLQFALRLDISTANAVMSIVENIQT